MDKYWLLLSAAISGFLSVALGAFGAHVIQRMISPEMYTVYQKAVTYQCYHTLALLALFSLPNSRYLSWAGIAFILGILLFSGSLYLLSVTGIRALGMITPIGGVSFLVGWGLIAQAAITFKRWV